MHPRQRRLHVGVEALQREQAQLAGGRIDWLAVWVQIDRDDVQRPHAVAVDRVHEVRAEQLKQLPVCKAGLVQQHGDVPQHVHPTAPHVRRARIRWIGQIVSRFVQPPEIPGPIGRPGARVARGHAGDDVRVFRREAQVIPGDRFVGQRVLARAGEEYLHQGGPRHAEVAQVRPRLLDRQVERQVPGVDRLAQHRVGGRVNVLGIGGELVRRPAGLRPGRDRERGVRRLVPEREHPPLVDDDPSRPGRYAVAHVGAERGIVAERVVVGGEQRGEAPWDFAARQVGEGGQDAGAVRDGEGARRDRRFKQLVGEVHVGHGRRAVVAVELDELGIGSGARAAPGARSSCP